MSKLELSLLFIIIFVVSGMAADVPFVFDENISDLAGSDSYLLEETSALSNDLAGIPPVSSPDYDYIIEVTLATNKSINRSSGDNYTSKSQDILSGLIELNQSSLANVTNLSQERFDTGIDPYYSIELLIPVSGATSSPKYWFEEGNKNYKIENYQKAIDCYDRAIKLDDELKEVWLNKGIALCKLEKYQDAINAFNQALKIDPDYSNAEKNREIAVNKTASNSGED